MLSYCLKCGKHTESKNLEFVRTKNGRIILLAKCAVGNKKTKLIKEQEAKGLLSSIGIRVPSSQIPLF